MEHTTNELIAKVINTRTKDGKKPTLLQVYRYLNSHVLKTLMSSSGFDNEYDQKAKIQLIKNYNDVAFLQNELNESKKIAANLKNQLTTNSIKVERYVQKNKVTNLKARNMITSLEDELKLIIQCFEELMLENDERGREIHKLKKYTNELERELQLVYEDVELAVVDEERHNVDKNAS